MSISSILAGKLQSQMLFVRMIVGCDDSCKCEEFLIGDSDSDGFTNGIAIFRVSILLKRIGLQYAMV